MGVAPKIVVGCSSFVVGKNSLCPRTQLPTTNDFDTKHAFRQIFGLWFVAQGVASARWNVHKGMRNRQTEVTIFAKPPCATMKPAVPHWKRRAL